MLIPSSAQADKRQKKSDKNMVWKIKLKNSKNKYQKNYLEKNYLEKTIFKTDFRFFRIGLKVV
jgi:hypothetical protein